ncbi:hypothetical protein [Frigidibacter sp. SD6-1]|nr:hypothetical protein [Frigidibacter sp. SD6-1]
MDIVRKQSNYITFSRMPKKGKFVEGRIFDSAGFCFEYSGECGWPRFGPVSSAILEPILIPAMLSKIQQHFFYFGPHLVGTRRVPIEEYKRQVLASIRQLGMGRRSEQLSRAIDDAPDARGVIEAVDRWRYHGGLRDADGHPIRNGA